jgi:hypothetical protein
VRVDASRQQSVLFCRFKINCHTEIFRELLHGSL